MADMNIWRNQTDDEKRDFKDIGPNRKKDAKTNFLTELSQVRLECVKRKIPFFKKAAMDDWDAYYKQEAEKSKKVHGFVNPEDIKPVKMDWSKYSSPDNIELMDVIEQRDAHATKKQPFEVMVRVYRYKYKGYGIDGEHNISVSEDEHDAVKRLKAGYENKEFSEKSIAEQVSENYTKSKQKSYNIPGISSISKLTENVRKPGRPPATVTK